jgi:putative PEP-CTERM system histidine kinase
MLAAGILALGVAREIYATYDLQAAGGGAVLIIGSLLTALYALVAIEQIYRNARESQRRSLKFLCIGVGGIFAYDLFLYSNAILAGYISELFWGVRGFVVAMCVPLIAVAVQRAPMWSIGIFVSRQIVFYTATLFGAGFYLTAVGIGGYYIRVIGREWGSAAQAIFFSAAIIILFVYLFSDASRARLRVFISKHFFENKYDYREQWLRLINTLTSAVEVLALRKRAIKALAEILDTSSGVLWLRDHDSDNYRCVSGWNANEGGVEIAGNDSLVEFLANSGWVVDLNEYAADSSRYENLDLSIESLSLSKAAFIIPLMHDSRLLGFVVLSATSTPISLNFEDHDLLKTAGQQIASYLAQEMITEQLTEVRQFETFNRLTAFLMHDLKNVIAQQSLVVENAKKHKANPLFIDDALETIKGSVARMRRVMEHFQHSPTDDRQQRVEVSKLIMQSVSQCADRKPVPRLLIGEAQIWVRADPERLLMALTHAIRNAQDATDADGDVAVSLEVTSGDCTVAITDTGSGMDDIFIRDRLFKPFDSTKGTQGMGIGAYQVRETIRSTGGDVQVSSQLGEGTTMLLYMNRAEP